MTTATQAHAVGRNLDLETIGAAMAMCDDQGRVLAGSSSGLALLNRLGICEVVLPAPMLPELWSQLAGREIGEAVQWRPLGESKLVLGCTRYAAGAHWLLVMREISQKHNVLAKRLHQQRLTALGRLVATTAHDLRAPLASVVFNADVLAARFSELSPDRMRESIGDIQIAATRLRGAIDCLLDYVRLGPPIPVEVSLQDIVGRAHNLLRAHLRTGGHKLVSELDEREARAIGNPLALEQIFVNLVLNAIEAATAPITVRVSSERQGVSLRVLVDDDGPGIPAEHRQHVFEPFFTTKPDGTGIGLNAARDAAREAHGDVELVRWEGGACFAVTIPAAQGGAR